jgi:aconitase B
MLPLDRRAAEKMMPELEEFATARSTYRVTIERDDRASFSADIRAHEAGAAVLTPGCNTCWGYLGVLSGKEVSITTHQFNYQGRNGSEEARVFLASPLTVAASAVEGKIADPRPYLQQPDFNAYLADGADDAHGAAAGAARPAPSGRH